ncbi:MAG: AAA family ATPase, partial [Deltaproteobacteria bacterium]|nr:AAA family ATPase [Deltaproteobacteria bacterium]
MAIERNILKELEKWKSSKNRKPLIFKGARQVGKTWILKEFGCSTFEKHGGVVHYIDLKEQKELHSIFKETNSPKKILKVIQLHTGKKINTTKDLLILDEIQDCEGAIGSLKYFEQSEKELAVVAAGSHMGLIANEESFPVGKVNFLYMFPMTFAEFLFAFNPELHHEFIE